MFQKVLHGYLEGDDDLVWWPEIHLYDLSEFRKAAAQKSLHPGCSTVAPAIIPTHHHPRNIFAQLFEKWVCQRLFYSYAIREIILRDNSIFFFSQFLANPFFCRYWKLRMKWPIYPWRSEYGKTPKRLLVELRWVKYKVVKYGGTFRPGKAETVHLILKDAHDVFLKPVRKMFINKYFYALGEYLIHNYVRELNNYVALCFTFKVHLYSIIFHQVHDYDKEEIFDSYVKNQLQIFIWSTHFMMMNFQIWEGYEADENGIYQDWTFICDRCRSRQV